jgi:hypothetical protein
VVRRQRPLLAGNLGAEPTGTEVSRSMLLSQARATRMGRRPKLSPSPRSVACFRNGCERATLSRLMSHSRSPARTRTAQRRSCCFCSASCWYGCK